MGDALSSILAFVVAISVLVAVHEYGHYIVGRWSGMKVLRFSIGFGKPLWKHIVSQGNQRENIGNYKQLLCFLLLGDSC